MPAICACRISLTSFLSNRHVRKPSYSHHICLSKPQVIKHPHYTHSSCNPRLLCPILISGSCSPSNSSPIPLPVIKPGSPQPATLPVKPGRLKPKIPSLLPPRIPPPPPFPHPANQAPAMHPPPRPASSRYCKIDNLACQMSERGAKLRTSQ